MSSIIRFPYLIPYKQQKSFEDRKREVIAIMKKYPARVPIIVERYATEKYLPLIDRTKYLVRTDMPLSSLTKLIRRRLNINERQSIYLVINNRSIILCSLSKIMSEIYRDYSDEDGFLYIAYASETVFGD